VAWFGKQEHVLPARAHSLTHMQTIHFLKSIKDPRFEDYDITYRYKNRFSYLGNGDVKATASRDVAGLSPYIRNSDHDWQVD
jgi:hypothetical protein